MQNGQPQGAARFVLASARRLIAYCQADEVLFFVSGQCHMFLQIVLDTHLLDQF